MRCTPGDRQARSRGAAEGSGAGLRSKPRGTTEPWNSGRSEGPGATPGPARVPDTEGLQDGRTMVWPWLPLHTPVHGSAAEDNATEPQTQKWQGPTDRSHQDALSRRFHHTAEQCRRYETRKKTPADPRGARRTLDPAASGIW